MIEQRSDTAIQKVITNVSEEALRYDYIEGSALSL